jgi:hypothetical protein
MNKEFVNQCIETANSGVSKLPPAILNMDGMSTHKTRHLFNNLGAWNGINYLEVGIWKAATSCSVIYNNTIIATLIDNFSQFSDMNFNPSNKNLGDAKQQAIINLSMTKLWSPRNSNIELIDADCFTYDLNKFKNKINFYFFDGEHSIETQHKAFSYYYDVLDQNFLAIIDDFDDQNTEGATEKSFYDLGMTISEKWHLKGNGAEPFNPNFWWNGLGIYLIRK